MDKFFYGASYYPLFREESDWEEEMKMIAETGLNFIRTAELFNSWDRIQPKPDKYNFAWLDKIFDLAAKYDIQILLGTGTASPPLWLKHKYEDVQIVSNSGQSYPTNASYTWACPHHFGYRKEAEKLIRTLAKRYGDHSALLAWHIHNEIGFPFMPIREGAGMDIYCYCDHSVAEFQDWVKDKYGSLDKLNDAWQYTATNTADYDWKKVDPPKSKPKSWSSVTRWLDWRLFWQDSFADFVGWQDELLEEIDPDHPTTTNIFWLKSQDRFGVLMGLDQRQMAEKVDYIGYDLYPGSGDKLQERPEYNSILMDHVKSIARANNIEYWVPELEGGPIGGWALGPEHNTKAKHFLRNAFQCIGHGTKLICQHAWHEWRQQPIHWGAIVDLEGKPTERTEAAAEIADFAAKNEDFLLNAAPPEGEIAILTSRKNEIILNGMGVEDFLFKAIRGAYRTFWELGYEVEFITPKDLRSGDISAYKAIYMPFMMTMEEDLSLQLDRYVKDGGVLFATAKNGYINEQGWYTYNRPVGNLKETFGIEVVEIEQKTLPVTVNGRTYQGYWHQEKINKVGAEEIATYTTDEPAVTINSRGEGWGVYITTHPDVGYIEEDSFLLWELIDKVSQRTGLQPEMSLEYAGRKHREIDFHRLKSNQKSEEMIIFTNYSADSDFFVAGKKKVKAYFRAKEKIKEIKDKKTGQLIDFNFQGGEYIFKLEINDGEIKAIEVKYE